MVVFFCLLLLLVVNIEDDTSSIHEVEIFSNSIIPETIYTKSAGLDVNRYDVSIDEVQQFIKLYFPKVEILQINPISEQEVKNIAYFVSFNKGWALISGDKRTDIVLAHSESESSDFKSLDNENLLYWIDRTVAGLLGIKENGLKESDIRRESLDLWDAIDILLKKKPETLNKRGILTKGTCSEGDPYNWKRYLLSVTSSPEIEIMNTGHLVQTKWGQDYPWNYNFPTDVDTVGVTHNCPVGCVAVAAGQLVYYYHYLYGVPSWLHHDSYISGTASLPLFHLGTTVNPSSRWDYFAKVTGGNGSHSADSISYVRSFLADVGHFITIPKIECYDLTCVSSLYNDYSFTTISQNILLQKPILVRGDRKDTLGVLHGHALIIDGIKQTSCTSTFVYLWVFDPNDGIDGDDYRVFTQSEAESYFYNDPSELFDGAITTVHVPFHYYYYWMNWGWGGQGDTTVYNSSVYDWSPSYDRVYSYNDYVYYNFSVK